MKNLAGNKNCDIDIREELILANVPLVELDEIIERSEVPYKIKGKKGNWTFKRAWYYWVVKADFGSGLPIKKAIKLHELPSEINPNEEMGKSIRVAGHCGCPHPTEFGGNVLGTIDSYHIDTQEGLNLFSEFLDSETTIAKKEIFLNKLKEYKDYYREAREDLSKVSVRGLVIAGKYFLDEIEKDFKEIIND